jgi:hypothetical protein
MFKLSLRKIKNLQYLSSFRNFHFPLWNRIHAWLSNRENLFFVALVLVHLIPIWIFQYFPSQDGPAHIENANLLRQYFHPDSTIFREYYIINKQLTPNWFGHLFLAGLMYIVPVLVAEKIFISGYIVLFPISIRYALRAIHLDKGFLAFMAFPFIYNFPLHMGFYNFTYSLPVFFLVVGYWIRYKRKLTLQATIILSLLLLLLYFCHLVSLVMAYVGISLLMVWLTLVDFANDARQCRMNIIRTFLNVFGRRAIPIFFAFLPPLILSFVFLHGHGVSGTNKWSVWNLSKHLLLLSSLWSYEKYGLLLSGAFVGLFVAVSINLLASKVVHRRWNRWDGLLLVFSAYVLLYFTTPDSMSGGDYISPRLLLFPFFALILWFGSESYQKVLKLRIMIVTILIALILLGVNITNYIRLNNYLKDYLSGTQLIAPNTTLLPLSFSHRGNGPDGQVLAGRISPFLFASGYIAAEKRIVELHNYEARTRYFPIIYRPNLNPFTHIWINENLMDRPHVNFLTYPERTGGRVDYVLVWGLQEQFYSYKEVKLIFEQLEKGYDLLYTSKRGLMQLYRRKNWQK